MRRKAGAGRPPPEIGQVTPEKALRAAVAQAAQDVAALVAVAGRVVEARVTLERAGEALPEQPLLALVEGPGGGFGLVVLDAQAVAALIEMQTTGRVVPRPAEPRAPTRTDAVMCADFIDRVLESLEQRVGEAGLDLAPALTGYRYAMALAEPRAVAMTLDDIAYRSFSVSVDFGHGAKTGQLQILLPQDPPGRGARALGDAEGFTEALQDRVMAAKAHLVARLARRRITLAELGALQVGSEITLPRAALSEVALEDLEGRVVARGRLGQALGHRALRLAAPADAGASMAGQGVAAAGLSLPVADTAPAPAAALPGPDPDPLAAFGSDPDAMPSVDDGP
ncbi:hypothetical protein GCM10011358_29860 [Sinisalibacter lacisalsi]|uniref:Flagellar motor switch protein FliN-like C-terminal domain-containing protein n=2 Tax=Sinisalibacter lacisalsi TaxID=1526570 RepID=A0ABQ1QSR9_9RHOB|nr:hypothetical protein GCM10011358_29860 [Sinisalibacter lacisalsi]